MRLCKPEFNTELGEKKEFGGEEAVAREGSMVLAVSYKGQDDSRVWAVTPGPCLRLKLCIPVARECVW